MFHIIHKKAIKPLAVTAIFWLFFILLEWDFLTTTLGLFLLVLLFLYRQPKRESIASKNIITAPVDGRIVGIERLENKICIRIEKSIFDAGIIRSPIKSKLIDLEKRHGLCLPHTNPMAKKLNERYKLSFFPRTRNGS